jgi:hypothetical protein
MGWTKAVKKEEPMQSQKERDRKAVASFGLAIGNAIKGRRDIGDVERSKPSQHRESTERLRETGQAREKAVASSW